MTEGEYQHGSHTRAAAAHAMSLLRSSAAWNDIEAAKEVGKSHYRPEASFERNITYLAMPAAVAEAYQSVSPQVLPGDDLTVGLLQLYQFVMAFDHGIDDSDPVALLQAFRMYRHAVPRLLAAFPPTLHDDVLRLFDVCMLDTFRTLYQERRQASHLLAERTQFTEIAINKAKLSHLVPKFIALRADNHDETDFISACQCKALDHMHVGMQWMDDVQDVAHDLDQGQPTWTLRLLEAWCEENDIQMRSLSQSLIRKLAYTSGIASQCAKEAIIEFEQAKRAISNLHMPMLNEILHALIVAQQANLRLIASLLARAEGCT